MLMDDVGKEGGESISEESRSQEERIAEGKHVMMGVNRYIGEAGQWHS